jgi:hypothetical protein
MHRAPFRSVGLGLSAGSLNLRSGEVTTLTIVVSGLEGLRYSVPLEIENKSPGVINMGGGVSQRVMIPPQQGSFTTTRQLTGIQPGGFTITATVTTKRDPSQAGLCNNVL